MARIFSLLCLLVFGANALPQAIQPQALLAVQSPELDPQDRVMIEEVLKLWEQASAAATASQTEPATQTETTGQSAPSTKNVFVSFLVQDDDTAKGAAVLGRSLAAVKSSAQRVLLHSVDLSDDSTKLLKDIGGWHLQRVQPLANPAPAQCGSHCSVFSKLRVWEAISDFETAVFLEPDTIVVSNIDSLFATQISKGQIAVVPSDNGLSNTGVFVFQPSKTTFASLLEKLDQFTKTVQTSSLEYDYSESTFIHAFYKPCLNSQTECVRNQIVALPTATNCAVDSSSCRSAFDSDPSKVSVFRFPHQRPQPWACKGVKTQIVSCCASNGDAGVVVEGWEKQGQQNLCASSPAFAKAYNSWADLWEKRAEPEASFTPPSAISPQADNTGDAPTTGDASAELLNTK